MRSCPSLRLSVSLAVCRSCCLSAVPSWASSQARSPMILRRALPCYSSSSAPVEGRPDVDANAARKNAAQEGATQEEARAKKIRRLPARAAAGTRASKSGRRGTRERGKIAAARMRAAEAAATQVRPVAGAPCLVTPGKAHRGRGGEERTNLRGSACLDRNLGARRRLRCQALRLCRSFLGPL